MSNNERIVIICGKKWKDVTNQTTAGETFSKEDVVRCGGRKPTFASNEEVL